MFPWLTLLFLITFVPALPLGCRGSKACGKFDSIPAGPYSLLNNLWGASQATSGSQCVTLDSLVGDVVKWSTKWEWTGDYSVKSYSNVQFNGVDQQLSAIHSIPTTWKWSQESNGAVYDVAYDLFTADSPGADSYRKNEIMIWLGYPETAGPISYRYDAQGKSIPIETALSFANHTWALHEGNNGYNMVYSFVTTNGPITSFSDDLYPFFKHLIDQGYISASEYLVVAQAGTEATRGNATFTTSHYQMTVN